MPVVREHFRSDDVSEAETYIHRSYGRVELDAQDLVFEESSVGDERFGLRRLDIRGGYSAECDLDAVIVVHSDAQYEWEIDGERGDAAEPVLFQPGYTLACRLEDTRVRVVALPLGALTELARTVYNDETLAVRFDGGRAVDPALLRAWRSASTLAFTAEESLDNDLARASLFRSIAVSTLEAFPLLGDRRERAETVAQQQRAYRSAVSFFEQNASLPITVDDAAAAAGVGSAALRRAFLAHSAAGRTPLQHLTAVRLDAARADIVATAIGSLDDLGEIASRWGFTVSSLTRQHLDVYGIRPQELLGL
ncbi:helix-turn-helix domain-containing protein [Microbacterium oleivorans]|uniref:helix-turn-helix domain-containing protein n=1 Tax=Microbacterium oleivorans TaxID=273677 RepID=UPI000766FE94|nr:helix-turn-helix domain-containing protein [Microbacterium oleivorans]